MDRRGSILSSHGFNENAKYEVIKYTPGGDIQTFLSGGTILDATRHLKVLRWATKDANWSLTKIKEREDTHISEHPFDFQSHTNRVAKYKNRWVDRAPFSRKSNKNFELKIIFSRQLRRNQKADLGWVLIAI